MMLDEIDKLGAVSWRLAQRTRDSTRNKTTVGSLSRSTVRSVKVFHRHRKSVGTDSAAVARSDGCDPTCGLQRSRETQIAKRYLVPRQIRENGLTAEQFEIADSAVLEIATRYSREAVSAS
jgi:ATP-dependent Lon protease